MVDKTFYSDIERATLQFIMSLTTVKDDFLSNVHGKFRKEYTNEDLDEQLVELLKERTLEDSIDLINNKLHKIGFEIQRVRSQTSNELYYVYVNTISDESSKISKYTPKEIEIIKKIVEQIITDPEADESYCISSKDAIRFCQIEGYSATQSTNFLTQLVHEGWFNFSKEGKYLLSLRTLSELKRTLIDQYGIKGFDSDEGHISLCFGCKEIVTLGIRCYNQSCNARFHKECQVHYSKVKDSMCPNPNCDINWSEKEPFPVGEACFKGPK